MSEIYGVQNKKQIYHHLTSGFIQAEELYLSKDICIKQKLFLEVRRLRMVGADVVHRSALHLLQSQSLQNSCSEDIR